METTGSLCLCLSCLIRTTETNTRETCNDKIWARTVYSSLFTGTLAPEQSFPCGTLHGEFLSDYSLALSYRFERHTVPASARSSSDCDRSIEKLWNILYLKRRCVRIHNRLILFSGVLNIVSLTQVSYAPLCSLARKKWIIIS